MKHHTRLCSLLLAGLMALSLAACSGGDTGNTLPPPTSASPSGSAEPSPSPSDAAEPSSDSILPSDFVPDTSVEDLCLATTGIPGTFALFTVNGTPVTACSYLYWLGSTVSYLNRSMAAYGMALDWDAPFAGDLTLAEYVKEDALTAATQYSLITSKAKELGYEMTQAQVDELESYFTQTITAMGGEEAFLDGLRKSALDYDTVYDLNAASYYYAQLEEGLLAGRPTEAEMDAYIQENDLLRAKHILLMTVDSATREPLDDDTIAQKKAAAEDIFAQLQASGDLLADFDTLMHEHSEDPGLAAYPDGYVFTAGDMVPEFESATRALAFGEISGLVESSSTGYHIILRLDPDTGETREQYRGDLLNEQMQTWIDEADIVLSDEYHALDARMFYEKISAYQEAFAAEEAAESQEDQ